MKKRKVQEIEAWDGEEKKGKRMVKILETGIDYGTFGNIWAASLCLARYVSTSDGTRRLEGKRVLELGSGTGLGGLSSVIFGNADSVVLTDMPIAMDDLNNNVSINKTKADDRRFSTMSLTMGNEDNESHEKIISLKPDIILCSDLMYNSKMIQLVCTTLRRVVKNSETSIWIVFTDRTVKGDPEPLEKLKAHGFQCTKKLDLMTLECCHSLCKIEEYDYLDDVQVWLWELHLNCT